MAPAAVRKLEAKSGGRGRRYRHHASKDKRANLTSVYARSTRRDLNECKFPGRRYRFLQNVSRESHS